MDNGYLKKIFFPYSSIRKVQEDLIEDVGAALRKRGQLIAHAPTGLGKTAATLSPILADIINKKDITIFFLTSRHTQHHIVLKTLKQIKDKYKVNFGAVSIIGKKWMCALPDTQGLYAKDFFAFCKAMRDDDMCEFYARIGTKSKPSIECRKALTQLSSVSPVGTSSIVSVGKNEKLCPYELSLLLASSAKVIVTDYYYLLDPTLRGMIMNKTGKKLENSILIFDEGHNLPARARELRTARLSLVIMERAINEAKKYRFEDATLYLIEIKEVLKSLAEGMKIGGEKIVSKQDFVEKLDKIKDYDEISAALEFAADEVRETERISYIGSVALFLEIWPGPDNGFSRIISKNETNRGEFVLLTYRCLDPSILTKELVTKSYATILMSGTLTPTSMYKDIIGFPSGAVEKTYSSPFPEKNRLAMIVPKTTTKFTMRNDAQYKEIARICSEIIDTIPGNCAVFFPSYSLRDKINIYLAELCKKKFFLEKPGMDKERRQEILEKFKNNKEEAVLLGVASGSFGEGIDIPGNILKGVIVVGLPLQKPTLETKELIKYYDEKFGKGWDYGYTMPAITKALQNAGRCIRSEKDKGVMVFLDKRYSWPGYIKYFPDDWDIKITVDYTEQIRNFFKNTKKV